MQKILLICSKSYLEEYEVDEKNLGSRIREICPSIQTYSEEDHKFKIGEILLNYTSSICAGYLWVVLIIQQNNLNNLNKNCFENYQNLIVINSMDCLCGPDEESEIPVLIDKIHNQYSINKNQIFIAKSTENGNVSVCLKRKLYNDQVLDYLKNITGFHKIPQNYASAYGRVDPKLYSFDPLKNNSKLLNKYIEEVSEKTLITIILPNVCPDNEFEKLKNRVIFLVNWITYITKSSTDIIVVEQSETLHSQLNVDFAKKLSGNTRHEIFSGLSYWSRGRSINYIYRKFGESYEILCFMDIDILPDQMLIESIINCANKYEVVSPYSHIYDADEHESERVYKNLKITALTDGNTLRKKSVSEGSFIVRSSFLNNLGGADQAKDLDAESQKFDMASLFKAGPYGIYSNYGLWIKLCTTLNIDNSDKAILNNNLVLECFYGLNNCSSVHDKYQAYKKIKDSEYRVVVNELLLLRKNINHDKDIPPVDSNRAALSLNKQNVSIKDINGSIRLGNLRNTIFHTINYLENKDPQHILTQQVKSKPNEFLILNSIEKDNFKALYATASLNSCSALIKSTGRISELHRLVSSIKNNAPGMPVIIVDDSGCDLTLVNNLLDSSDRLIELGDVDVGLSEGRNILINNCKTEYLLLLDDDFYIMPDSCLLSGLRELKQRNLDILGGAVFDYGYASSIKEMPRDFRGYLHMDDAQTLYISSLPISNEHKEKSMHGLVDLVMNFFIARRTSIEAVMWDSSLKLGEHLDFFIRSKFNNLKISYFPEMYTMHHRPSGEIDVAYQEKRARAHYFIEENFKKHGINKVIKNGEIIKG